ncbi:hypothetical protein CAY53_11125 [Desulfobulbus oralis]|uniref:Uncharacterized protein n=1 Tax=Desulfobulbus oralis TaxID=1986146 RepID=A0A2L1GQJ0_9BACT|nr:hypothetical protein CAY53_11125 [Desulfobulbus oralis]
MLCLKLLLGFTQWARANNPQVMPRIEAMIANGDASQGELLGACVEGLTTLWYHYPFFDSFDSRA